MTKETGTLAELNVKPGDVVECVGWLDDDDNDFLVGKQYTIMEKHPKGHYDDLCAVREGRGWTRVYNEDAKMLFRIVSRASDTPKKWCEMTDEEKGAILLAEHRGEVVEIWGGNGWWSPCSVGRYQGSAYRVRPPEPKRDTVTIYGAPSKHIQWCLEQCGLDTHRITLPLLDGNIPAGTYTSEAGEAIIVEEL
jgi:hypothetical protein